MTKNPGSLIGAIVLIVGSVVVFGLIFWSRVRVPDSAIEGVESRITALPSVSFEGQTVDLLNGRQVIGSIPLTADKNNFGRANPFSAI